MAMTTIGMQYNVIAGKEAEFERGFSAVQGALKATPGHVESRLYQDTQTPGCYLILSEWKDQAAFNSFIQSEAFAKVTQWGKAEILRNRPRHRVYSENE